jgi:isopenicillin-N epimerase
MERNRKSALAARDALCRTLGIEKPAPDTMIGALATVPLPLLEGAPVGPSDPLQEALWEKHRIEVPMWNWPSPRARLLRVSLQAYNRPDDLERLCEALRTERVA